MCRTRCSNTFEVLNILDATCENVAESLIAEGLVEVRRAGLRSTE